MGRSWFAPFLPRAALFRGRSLSFVSYHSGAFLQAVGVWAERWCAGARHIGRKAAKRQTLRFAYPVICALPGVWRRIVNHFTKTTQNPAVRRKPHIGKGLCAYEATKTPAGAFEPAVRSVRQMQRLKYGKGQDPVPCIMHVWTSGRRFAAKPKALANTPLFKRSKFAQAGAFLKKLFGRDVMIKFVYKIKACCARAAVRFSFANFLFAWYNLKLYTRVSVCFRHRGAGVKFCRRGKDRWQRQHIAKEKGRRTAEIRRAGMRAAKCRPALRCLLWGRSCW